MASRSKLTLIRCREEWKTIHGQTICLGPHVTLDRLSGMTLNWLSNMNLVPPWPVDGNWHILKTKPLTRDPHMDSYSVGTGNSFNLISPLLLRTIVVTT